MSMLRLTGGIKHYCYTFFGCINRNDKWSHYMQMHLCARRLKNVQEHGQIAYTPLGCVCVVRVRVCAIGVCHGTVGDSICTDGWILKDYGMNQLKLFMHIMTQWWRCLVGYDGCNTDSYFILFFPPFAYSDYYLPRLCLWGWNLTFEFRKTSSG